ncbi:MULTISPECIES: transcriptional repressor AgaR [unclassified Duganella]|jgi:DeoR family transcriptional regulator of aga operon|uniref:transcriptional repressor AgaR n=1 Tax=unclassified Duganella TaxID=2636909 RepID=UPI000883F637|nr:MULTISPECIES: transcriptional repressor AgaR [unclassified Duganella]SDG77376.1 transcriptional regulator, DeoR family [Duganella sp. OV458]SDK04350.1 transcriptional regulator, DeoR family [Duganella sp. OV510]
MAKTGHRRAMIMKALTEHGSVQVNELVRQLGVSAVTIRSDLCKLESQGLAIRSHGGATAARTPPTEHAIPQRDAINHDQKERIGALAATMVKPGDNVIIDSGTTTITLARHLRDAENVTVMTNGLNIAWELAEAPGVDLILTGGLLRKQSLSLQGLQAEACLQAYSFDKLFLGVDGFDLQFGVTTHHEAEATLNHKMVERARKVIVLTDASKFGCVSLHRIIQLNRVHTVITDARISDEYRDGLVNAGIELLIAD